MEIVCILVSLFASIVGAVCGIGGGVIIKPVLDLTGVTTAATAGFLSGCTVLSMTGYNILRSRGSKDNKLDYAVSTPLAIGAVLGGFAGSSLFSLVDTLTGKSAMTVKVQAVALALATLATLIYTLKKNGIETKSFRSPIFCAIAGLLLGMISSFLGIGGGPINLMVLSYFFGMDSKTAAQNSLYLILFSQAVSVLKTILSGAIPAVNPFILLLMILGGVFGGMIGRSVNKKIDNATVDKLFVAVMALIIGICGYNCLK